jgi:hypothetical protein
MPRTLPVVVIIFAACMGLPHHWGTFRLTTAFLVAAFAVLLISAMAASPPVISGKPVHSNHIAENVKQFLRFRGVFPASVETIAYNPLDNAR